MWLKKGILSSLNPCSDLFLLFFSSHSPFSQFGALLLSGKGVTGKFHKGLVAVWPRGPRGEKPHEEAADPQWHHWSEINSSDNWGHLRRTTSRSTSVLGCLKMAAAFVRNGDARDGSWKPAADCFLWSSRRWSHCGTDLQTCCSGRNFILPPSTCGPPAAYSQVCGWWLTKCHLVTLKWLQVESFLYRVGERRKAVIPWERRGRSAEKNLSISFEKHVSSRSFRRKRSDFFNEPLRCWGLRLKSSGRQWLNSQTTRWTITGCWPPLLTY